jgi:hypothetical protein
MAAGAGADVEPEAVSDEPAATAPAVEDTPAPKKTSRGRRRPSSARKAAAKRTKAAE